jgi:hypothetical protein
MLIVNVLICVGFEKGLVEKLQKEIKWKPTVQRATFDHIPIRYSLL